MAMIDIGIDFGSTYTMVSVCEDGVPVTIQPDGLSYNYPSVVVYDCVKNKYFFGKAARGRMGGKNTITYRGFKMLLNQQMSKENLVSRGYDNINTPEYITEIFLRYVIENTLAKLGEDKVGTLVVGAPECWFQSINTIDARSVLRDICIKMSDIVTEVKIISEPTNAAAFSVWNYEQMTGEKLNGKILVIDYGGGTLDTALVEVTQKNGSLQIKPEMRSGAGENRNNEIGSAGIAFQEAVARLAISEALDMPKDSIEYDTYFNKFLKQFEEQLLSQTAVIETVINEYTFDVDGLKDEYFCELDYGAESVEINYYHLYQCYQEVISPVLKMVLDDTTKNMDNIQNFHLALVGGFCNFCLVKNQIYEYFKVSERDSRIDGMIKEEAQREKAIAHGAALFASEIITVCNIAQFSIGTYAIFPDGTRFDRYAINFGQEIEPDTVYFAEDDNGVPYPTTSGSIDMFLLNFTPHKSTAMDMRPKEEFAKLLMSVSCSLVVVIGFSMDICDKITVHVYNYDIERGMREEKPVASLTLATMKEMFESVVLTGLGGV